MAVPSPPSRPPYFPPGGSTQPSPAGAPVGAGQVFVPNSNGGVYGVGNLALFPCQSMLDGTVSYFSFDPSQGYNDPNSSSQYFWRAEQIAPYRQATFRRIIVTYRDLGRVTVTFTISGGNDQGQFVSNSTSLSWGNLVPTNKLFTTPVDLLLTGLNLQLSVFRGMNAGSLSIVQTVLVGEVEENTL